MSSTKEIILDALFKKTPIKATHVLKMTFRDHKIWEIGSMVCIERSRVAFLTESREISIGGSLHNWADIYDIDNFRPVFAWFDSIEKMEKK